MQPTIVHVCRHGQVHNPDEVLYGRLDGFGLSELGRAMADRLAEHFAEVPLAGLYTSPLQRARETLAPIAATHPHLAISEEHRLTEAANVFEGQSFGRYNERLLYPVNAWHLRNPLRPSWGEPYRMIAGRMTAALHDIAEATPSGGESLVVSHQLPITIARRSATGRPLAHHPQQRECRQASVTSFSFVGGRVAGVSYSEPCADLYPPQGRLFRPGA